MIEGYPDIDKQNDNEHFIHQTSARKVQVNDDLDGMPRNGTEWLGDTSTRHPAIDGEVATKRDRWRT